MPISSHRSIVYLSDTTAISNYENINVNATTARKAWRLIPAADTKIEVIGLRIVASIAGAISTYANFLGVTVSEDAQIRIDVNHNVTLDTAIATNGTTTFDFAASHTYGFRSIGDALAGSVMNMTILAISPGCISFDMAFVSEGKAGGLVFNGYPSGASESSDYLSVSHKANLSSLNFMKAAALITKVSSPS